MVTELAPRVEPALAQGDRHGKRTPFPRVLEDKLATLPGKGRLPFHISDMALRECARCAFVELHPSDPDHRVPGHQRSQFLFGQLFGPKGTLRKDHVTSFSTAIPHQNLDCFIKLKTELTQDTTGVAGHAGAVG